jgi:dTDP-glucose 4,6-dehydratase
LASEKRAARVLFVSSGAVYGRQTAGLANISEYVAGSSDPLLSTNGYAEGKRAAEYLCGRAARTTGGGPVVTVARCFAFVGPYLPLNAHLAIGNFIRDAVTTGRIQVRSDGTAVRSYLYAADLAEWLFTILVRGESGRAYNVGSEEALSVAAVARRVADASAAVSPDRDRPTVTIAHPTPVVSAGDRYVPDCARARVELGLVPRVSFDAALRRTIVWAALRNRSASNEDC